MQPFSASVGWEREDPVLEDEGEALVSEAIVVVVVGADLVGDRSVGETRRRSREDEFHVAVLSALKQHRYVLAVDRTAKRGMIVRPFNKLDGHIASYRRAAVGDPQPIGEAVPALVNTQQLSNHSGAEVALGLPMSKAELFTRIPGARNRDSDRYCAQDNACEGHGRED